MVALTDVTSAAVSGTSVTVDAPANLGVGDTVLVATWARYGDANFTPPAGFTEISDGTPIAGPGPMSLWVKDATAAEPASYTFSGATGAGSSLAIAARLDNVVMVDAVGDEADVIVATPVDYIHAPSVETTADGLLIGIGGARMTATSPALGFVASDGMTLAASVNTDPAATHDALGLYHVAVPVGPTGSRDMETNKSGTVTGKGFLVALVANVVSVYPSPAMAAGSALAPEVSPSAVPVAPAAASATTVAAVPSGSGVNWLPSGGPATASAVAHEPAVSAGESFPAQVLPPTAVGTGTGHAPTVMAGTGLTAIPAPTGLATGTAAAPTVVGISNTLVIPKVATALAVPAAPVVIGAVVERNLSIVEATGPTLGWETLDPIVRTIETTPPALDYLAGPPGSGLSTTEPVRRKE